jgi:hypothetical protein
MDGSEILERAQDAGLEDTLAELLARPRDEAVSEIERTVIGQDAVVEEVVDLMYACLERMLRRAEGTDELDLRVPVPSCLPAQRLRQVLPDEGCRACAEAADRDDRLHGHHGRWLGRRLRLSRS